MSRNMSDKMNHLSPWDLSGVGMGFGLYRPRRPSYTFATQAQRQRSESYRYAVRKGTSDTEEPADFIEGIIQRKNRKESYIRATRHEDQMDVEMSEVREAMRALDEDLEEPEIATTTVGLPPVPASPIILINDQGPSNSNNINHANHMEHYEKLNGTNTQNRLSMPNMTQSMLPNMPSALSENHILELKEVVALKRYSPNHEYTPSNYDETSNRIRKTGMTLPVNDTSDDVNEDSVFTSEFSNDAQGATTPSSGDMPPLTGFKRIRFKKNLVLLCVSFIFIFNAFRAIQNLQSSLNSDGYLGIISMSCVHGTMCLTCLWAPVVINQFTAKWTLVCGMSTYILWIAANFYPRFYTLIPFGILVGVGKGILWTAESSYILKLSFDYSRVTKEGLDKEMFRFHGIFLACFQTTHIWGNLISSLVLHSAKNSHEAGQQPSSDYMMDMNMTYIGGDMSGGSSLTMPGGSCGVLFPCQHSSSSNDITKDVPSTLWKLMSAYIVLGFVAFCLTILCLDKIGARFDPEKTGYEIVVDHFQLMLTHKTFRLLIPLLIFSGLQQAFIFSDFTEAYVSCTIGEEYIGYCMIVLGLANVISAILVAVCANVIAREVVFGIGGILHMGLMIGLLIWIPDSRLLIFFVMSASWGICDAVWQTQCNTLICITCPENAEVAFANYRLLQSFGLTVGFLSGTFLCVSFKLYILMILLVVAIMFYVLAEYKVRQVDSDVFEGSIEVN